MITRERLLAEGLRLFAERGFRETTVGDIELAAGLVPRRGALYRHFASKEELLRVAVEAHVASIEAGLAALDGRTGIDTQAQALAAGRWFLREMDAERALFRILEHEGERLAELRAFVRERVIEAGHRRVSAIVARRAGRRVDSDAVAVLLIGALANHRRNTWTFGAAPLAVEDERLLKAWVRWFIALAPPPTSGR